MQWTILWIEKINFVSEYEHTEGQLQRDEIQVESRLNYQMHNMSI